MRLIYAWLLSYARLRAMSIYFPYTYTNLKTSANVVEDSVDQATDFLVM